jgi:Universal stress protein family
MDASPTTEADTESATTLALGSVSERVAHRSPCSVLVVRRANHPAQEDAAVPSLLGRKA